MGLLESILGSPSSPEEPDREPTIDLPEDEYTVASPVPVKRSNLEAFTAVIAAERDTPPLDDPGFELVRKAMNETWKQSMPGDETWEESMERTRSNAEQILEFWLDAVSEEWDVIFLPVGAVFPLEAALITCEERADSDGDPFTLPEEFMDAVSLMKKLKTAEEEREPVFVHQDQIPPVP